MTSERVIIKNQFGLHMRTAAIFARAAASCRSTITLISGDKRVNPKSALFLMSACVKCGDEITLICDGPTCEQDMRFLLDTLENGLSEEPEVPK